MKCPTVAALLALAVTANASGVPSLTPDNYDELTAGKVRRKKLHDVLHDNRSFHV